MCHLIMKKGCKEITKIIRMLGEKENYKYWGILKANNIKQIEMKKKEEKITQEKRVKFTCIKENWNLNRMYLRH